jgi:hypothetical protein
VVDGCAAVGLGPELGALVLGGDEVTGNGALGTITRGAVLGAVRAAGGRVVLGAGDGLGGDGGGLSAALGATGDRGSAPGPGLKIRNSASHTIGTTTTVHQNTAMSSRRVSTGLPGRIVGST